MCVQRKLNWDPCFANRMAGMQASEIRELLKVAERPDVISFAGGIPDPALFAQSHIRQAYDKILSDPVLARKALQYSVSEGDAGLRAWIATHMASKGVDCTPDNILITNGSQQALEFIGKLFISPGDTALVNAPTYLGALQAFAPNQPMYDDLQLENTNRTISSYHSTAKALGSHVRFSYVVPDFANPTGETMSKEARIKLLDLARGLNIPIVEDSPYYALRFDGAPVRSIQALDIDQCGTIEHARVMYCGSFSKIFTPGLRVGWVCARKDIITRLCLIKQASDLNSPAINQLVMLHLAQTTYDTQVNNAIAHYRKKRDVMLEALEKYMPKGAVWSRPKGGMFIWLTLPKDIDTTAILPKAIAQCGVAYVPGDAFFANKSAKNMLRLSYSLPALEKIAPGIAKLATLF